MFKVYKNKLRKDAPFELVYYKSYDLDCKKDYRVNSYLVNPQSWKPKEDNRYKKTFDDKSFCIIYTWVFEKIVVDPTNNSISFINKFNKKILGIKVVRTLLKDTVKRLQENQYPIEKKIIYNMKILKNFFLFYYLNLYIYYYICILLWN